MARSAHKSPQAFPAEIARYLCMEPEDVRNMIALDRLPALKIPKAKRSVLRVPLRDFHAWLCKRALSPVPELATYETFLADFDATARADRAKPAA